MPEPQEKSYGIKVRYEPSVEKNLVADIVFIHGLIGSADSTWTTEKGDVHWPSQLLCHDSADARISTFGYDADVVSLWNPVSQNRISNHAENLLGSLSRLRERTETDDIKIIFVAHSLGGLIVQNALDLSRGSIEPHIRQLELSTVGICFLGTPHVGSDLAQWGRFGASAAKLFKRSNTDIVKVLKPGSEMLSSIQSRFHSILINRCPKVRWILIELTI
ncbi:hypothetical protein MMC10_011032 [Thelotrema lepadinum]|nr:hypothetical protein [Thelotrema lepadinum]